MKQPYFIAFCLVLLTLTGCGPSYSVFYDQDPQADFGALRTYQLIYAGSEQPRTELTRNHITASIHEMMLNRGYELDTITPDVILAYDGRVQQKRQVAVENNPAIYGPQWGYYGWDSYEYREYDYNQGTLVIDFVQPDSKQLLWQGGVTATVGDGGATYDQIRKAVQSIFMKYPYIAGSNQRIAPARARSLSTYKEEVGDKNSRKNTNKVSQ